VSKTLATGWFGQTTLGGTTFRLDESGPVTKLWLKLGRCPALEAVERSEGRTYFRFADGTVVWQREPNGGVEVLGDR
jgi:hypothetical protein